MKLTIKAQFCILFAVVSLITSAAGVLTIYELRQLRSAMVEVDDNWLPSTREVAKMLSAAKQYRLDQSMHLLSTDEASMRNYEQGMDSSIAAFSKARKTYDPLITEGPESQLVAKIDQTWSDYLKTSQTQIAMSKQNQDVEATALFKGELEKTFGVLTEFLEQDLLIQTDGGNASSALGNDSYRESVLLICASIVFSLLSVSGMIFWIMINLSGTLRRIAASYQEGAAKVTSSTQETSDAVSSLVASSEETSTQTKLVLKNSSEASGYVASVAKAIEELNVSIGDISQSISDTTRCVADAVTQAQETQKVVTTLGNAAEKIGECHSASKIDPRIASSRMLLDNFSPMIGSGPSNWFGGVYGGKDQHGRAARGGVGSNGALPVGQTRGEGADPRRAVRDDGLASQACGARAPATRDGRIGQARDNKKAKTQILRDDQGRADGAVGGVG